MKVIIAGGRNITYWPTVGRAIKLSKFDITEVVSGGATGVDYLGESFAKLASLKLTIFKADWDAHGKAAGPIRNKTMAAYADALIAVWDGKSRGTKNMIEEMKKLNKLVYVHLVE